MWVWSQFYETYILMFWQEKWCPGVTILHMQRHLSCCDMCNLVTSFVSLESILEQKGLLQDFNYNPKASSWNEFLVPCISGTELTERSRHASLQTWLLYVIRFMGPTWGPSEADRTQVGPMLAPWTLLSGMCLPMILKAMIATRLTFYMTYGFLACQLYPYFPLSSYFYSWEMWYI